MTLALGSPGVLEAGVQGLGKTQQQGFRRGFVAREGSCLGFIGSSVCGEKRIAAVAGSSGRTANGNGVRASLNQIAKQFRPDNLKDGRLENSNRSTIRIHGGVNNIRAATAPGRSGGGVLDRPTLEKPTPGRESEFDLKKSRKLSPPYRVMLHNDSYNKREYVVQVLMKVIPGMSVDNAVNIMQEAHINGLAVVIICAQSDAEEHCMSLRNNGLLSSIEPATGGC